MVQFNPETRLLIAGFGNPLLQDEGAGIEVIQRLSKLSLPENVELCDGGTMGIGTVSLLEEYEQAIIVDCLISDQVSDDIVEFSINEVEFNHQEDFFSIHQLNLNVVLNLMMTLKMKIPDLYFFGIVPRSLDYHIGLTNEVAKIVDSVVNKIHSLIKVRN